MPSRILREGILTSEAVSSLSWPAEVFYRRLMSVVDDYGRYHGIPKLVRAACYPLHIDKVSDSDIGKWTAECAAAGLVRVYSASDGKRYLEIVKFNQQVRSKSKFPEPIESGREEPQAPDSNCLQANTTVHSVGVVSVIGGVSPSPAGEGQPSLGLLEDPPPPAPPKADYPEAFEEWWRIYPRKVGKGDAYKAWQKARDLLPKDRWPLLIDSVRAYARSVQGQETDFMPHPATWLNGRRYDDPLPEPSRRRPGGYVPMASPAGG